MATRHVGLKARYRISTVMSNMLIPKELMYIAAWVSVLQ
jgi:hypothetical protein